MKLERIQQGAAGTIRVTFTLDGVATDPEPDDATVTLTRDSDGTTLGPYDCYDEGEGAFSHTLTPEETADLDNLTAAWTVTYDGYEQTLTTRVEIVGGFLFALADLLALKPGNLTWTTEQMAEMRMTVEQSIEDEYGTALVPRYARKTVNAYGDAHITLRSPIRAIRSATVNGTALSGDQLDVLAINGASVTGYGWSSWPVTVDYEYGLDQPPRRLKQAGIRLARQWMVNGPIDDRALGAASPDGNFSFGLATPGRNGSIFGLPDLDAAIQASPYRVLVA